MMKHIRNHMMLAADMAGAKRAATRIGTVTSYDPDDHAAVVKLHPDGTPTGWLPILSQWVGNSWGLFAPPSIGDLVEVQFVDDNLEVGFICQRFYTDKNRPLSVPAGEFWLVHESGSLLKFHNDGSVELQAAGTLTSSASQWNHTGNVHIHGDLTVSHDIYDRDGLKGTLQHVRDNYDVHTHPDAQGGNTGTPNNSL